MFTPNQDIKMTIRVLMFLIDLREFPSSQCFCKGEFLNREVKDLVSCCRQTFHHSCLCDVTVCPYWKKPLASILCAVCGRPIHSPVDWCTYMSLERRKCTPMPCCSADVHSHSRNKIGRECPERSDNLDHTHTHTCSCKLCARRCVCIFLSLWLCCLLYPNLLVS